MKHKGAIFAVIVVCIAAFFLISDATSRYPENKWTRLVEQCGRVLANVRNMSDQSIPEGTLLDAKAIGIFPSTISAGLGLGGEYGQGIIMVKDKLGGRWSSPAIFTLAGGSIGWQIGGQATDIILIFRDQQSVNAILQGKLKLGADASVAAGPVGRNASAATDIQFKGGILSYSVSRGLFIGARLEGAVLTQHWDGNQELYGKRLSAEEILFENKAKMPKCARRVLRALARYKILMYIINKFSK